MKSKKSFFNPVIFCKDLTRLWPIWVLELVGLHLAVVMPFFSKLSADIRLMKQGKLHSGMGVKEIVAERLDYNGNLLSAPSLAGILSVLIAVFVFSYLTKPKEAYTIHSFPMRRETLFFSHYLAGLVMLLVPYLLAYLEIICIAASYDGRFTGVLFVELAISLIGLLLFYHLACMVVMLTGNSIMTVIIYTVLNGLCVGIVYLFSFVAEIMIYGYSGDFASGADTVMIWLTPVLNLRNYTYLSAYYSWGGDDGIVEEIMKKGRIWDGASLEQAVWYLVPAILFLALAVILYKKRQVESAGDMVAFSWGKAIFRLVFTVCGSVVFTVGLYYICLESRGDEYTYENIFQVFMVLMALGCILCYLIGNMILERSFFIWKKTSYVRMILVTAAVVGCMCYLKFGGYGTKIPSAEEIDMVCLESQECYNPWVDNTYTLHDKEQIQKFISLHTAVLEYGKEAPVSNRYDEDVSLDITYVLKNGRRINRRYPISTEAKEYLAICRLLNNPDTMCSMLFSEDYEEVIPFRVHFLEAPDDVQCSEEQTVISTEWMEKLYHALLEDIRTGKITLMNNNIAEEGEDYIDVAITIPKEICKKRGYSESYREAMQQSVALQIPKGRSNLEKVMTAMPSEVLREETHE